MHKKKLRLSIFLLLALALIMVPVLTSCAEDEATPAPTAAPTSGPATPPPDALIKFGAIFDLSGPASGFHIPVHQGYVDYWAYVNEVKGGINGIPVEAQFADTQYKSSLVMSSYKDWVDDGVVVIFSNLSLANDMLKDLLARDQILMTTSTGTVNTWWPVGWIYGPAPVYAEQCGLMLDYIAETWTGAEPAKVAILMPEAPYGHEPALAIPYGQMLGLQFVGEEYHPSLPGDLTPQLLRLKEAGADWIISFGMGHILTPIAQGLDQLNWHPNVVGLQDPYQGMGEVVVKKPEMSALFEGFYGTMYSNPMGPGYTEWVPGYELLFEAYKKYRDADATDFAHGFYRAFMPNMIMVEEAIKRTLDAVGYENLNGATIKEYGFDTMKDFDAMGIGAPITYTSDDHRGLQHMRIYQWQSGEVVLVQDWTKQPIIK
ncbi:ABC transporter substrate-binding protein [Chloroflexota bacterium]